MESIVVVFGRVVVVDESVVVGVELWVERIRRDVVGGWESCSGVGTVVVVDKRVVVGVELGGEDCSGIGSVVVRG